MMGGCGNVLRTTHATEIWKVASKKLFHVVENNVCMVYTPSDVLNLLCFKKKVEIKPLKLLSTQVFMSSSGWLNDRVQTFAGK